MIKQIKKAMIDEPGGTFKQYKYDNYSRSGHSTGTEYWYEKGSTRYPMKSTAVQHYKKKGHKFFE